MPSLPFDRNARKHIKSENGGKGMDYERIAIYVDFFNIVGPNSQYWLNGLQ